MTAEKLDFQVKVLHVSPECAPLAKKGGLGDVVGSLPKALRSLGLDARVLMPAWPGVLDMARSLSALPSRPIGSISAALNWRALTARLWRAQIDGLPVYILQNDELFANENIYPEQMDAVTAEPMLFLSYAAFELSRAARWKPHIIHAHDWPTAAVPCALRWHRACSKLAGDFDTVYTIHNMAHQGLFQQECLNGWGFSPDAFSQFNPGSMEFYGQANLMKGAINTADAITTVSPSYSWDIQTQDGGFGLDGVISANRSKLRGILNGIDYDVWNPSKDALIPAHFSADDRSGKKLCRAALMEKFNWQDDGRPLVIFVGRLTEQKGVDIMLDALNRFMPDMIYALIIGSGSELYNRKLADFELNHMESVRTVTAFSEESAHCAYAAGDILLMPSLFEPCGLSQLIAFAYGAIPVARATGGLADTVRDADSSPDGTGFLFTDYSVSELEAALNRALSAKAEPERWDKIVSNAMNEDFSWNASAHEYAALYGDVITAE
ncbi:MAG: glycogen/starch synthase [Synergistaceae bacterium]|nr:glycogen/starch synthase [Synergistaceae bacterium]